MRRPTDVRIRFDDFGVSAEARAVLFDFFETLSPEEREQVVGDDQIMSPRARDIVERIGAMPEPEWSALARFLAAANLVLLSDERGA